MLEVKWKEANYGRGFAVSTRFNPCYVGSKMESSMITNIRAVLNTVSILVMLEVKWKGDKGKEASEFSDCFNPCYVGSKMESTAVTFNDLECKQFQSLLCWK